MKCDDALNAMQTALDAGRATPPESVRRHLDHCEECRWAWSQLLQIESSLSDLGAEPIDPPSTIHNSIMLALENEKPAGKPARARRLVFAAGLSAAALLLFFIGKIASLNDVDTSRPDQEIGFIMPTLAFDERALDPVSAAIVKQSGDELNGLAKSFQASLASAQNAVQ